MSLPKQHPVFFPAPSKPAFLSAQSGDRAGAYTVAELQHLLKPVLAGEEAGDSQERRWPLRITLPLILASSLGMWYGLIAGMMALVRSG